MIAHRSKRLSEWLIASQDSSGLEQTPQDFLTKTAEGRDFVVVTFSLLLLRFATVSLEIRQS
jgi:hypothetical protein